MARKFKLIFALHSYICCKKLNLLRLLTKVIVVTLLPDASLAVPPLRLERKGLGNVAYTTCTLWNADLVIRRSLLKSVIIFNFL